MASCSSSMTFFELPREIRDLVYSFIVPVNETYTILCGSETPHPQFIFLAKPDLGILWTSKAIQREFLESICAIKKLRVTFPGEYTSVRHLSQDQENLMQHVKIDFNLRRYINEVLFIYEDDEMDHEMCQITVRNEHALDFSFVPLELVCDIEYLDEFKTVIVVPNIKWDKVISSRLQRRMGFTLGSSPMNYEDAAEFNGFHPRKYLSWQWW